MLNFEQFTEEATRQAETLRDVRNKKTSPPPPKKEPETKQVDDKFNGCVYIAEKLKGLFWRCSISSKIYRVLDNTEVTEAEAKTLCFNMKMVAPIKTEDFWLYLSSTYIEERNVLGEFFASLKQPNVDYMALYFDALNLTNQSQFAILQSIFRKWLIGAVAMVSEKQFYPNVLCPVLISDVNKGKTSFFKKLTFGTDIHKYSTVHRFSGGGGLDKDIQSLFARCFLICVDDLDKKDFRKSSAFRTLISSEKFFFRPPYEKSEKEKDRISSLCGTTNEKDIISDPQNNRRIVPIEIDSIDFDKLNIITAQQIWASAYEAYKAGEVWTLTDSEVSFIQQASGAYTSTAGLGDYILEHIQPCPKSKEANFAPATELYQTLIAQHPEFSKHFNIDKFAQKLRECGFLYGSKRTKEKPNGCKGYYYI